MPIGFRNGMTMPRTRMMRSTFTIAGAAITAASPGKESSAACLHVDLLFGARRMLMMGEQPVAQMLHLIDGVAGLGVHHLAGASIYGEVAVQSEQQEVRFKAGDLHARPRHHTLRLRRGRRRPILCQPGFGIWGRAPSAETVKVWPLNIGLPVIISNLTG